MATLNYKILPARRKSSGKLGIYLAVSHKKEVRYISTEFEIDDESQFEDGKVCYRKDALIMNKRMAYVLSTYQEKLAALDLKRFASCSRLKDELTKQEEENKSMTLEELMDMRINRFKKENRTTSASLNKETKGIITSHLGNPFIKYLTKADVNLLYKKMTDHGYSSSTINIRLSHLKAALNEAIRNKWVKYEDHPFDGFKMPAMTMRLMDVSVEEFQKIRDFKTRKEKLALARDLFLLSFYLGGINLIDLVDADLSGDELRYQRKKTINKKSGENMTCFRIPDEAKALIKVHAPRGKLVWAKRPAQNDYKLRLAYVGTCFALLKKELGIKTQFSYYSGRKTFAQFAFMLGIRTEVIEYCVGQTMKANRPIYNYVRVMQRQADLAIRKVIDYTIDPSSLNLYDVL